MPAHRKDRAEECNFFCSIKLEVQGRALQRPAKLPLLFCVAFQSPASPASPLSGWSVDPDLPSRREPPSYHLATPMSP